MDLYISFTRGLKALATVTAAMHPRLFLLTLLLLMSASAADRVALVIGNNQYPADGNLQTLRNCVNDARLVGRALETVGFGARC